MTDEPKLYTATLSGNAEVGVGTLIQWAYDENGEPAKTITYEGIDYVLAGTTNAAWHAFEYRRA